MMSIQKQQSNALWICNSDSWQVSEWIHSIVGHKDDSSSPWWQQPEDSLTAFLCKPLQPKETVWLHGWRWQISLRRMYPREQEQCFGILSCYCRDIRRTNEAEHNRKRLGIVSKTFSDTFRPTAESHCGFHLSTSDESNPLSSPSSYTSSLFGIFGLSTTKHIFLKHCWFVLSILVYLTTNKPINSFVSFDLHRYTCSLSDIWSLTQKT